MKHFLKIFIPALLILAILVAAGWFFFAHRTDLTMSVFAYWGDHYYEVGRYNRAITCYRQAVKLAPDNVSLPIRLAETYILSGNYSKAEYTLVSAITQNPDSVALYAALSKTYIEQDKLLDAEQMLGRITSADVKAQIDALRPTTPVFSPETGYYTEYIDVTITSGGSPVYITLNEDYPSIATDTYTGSYTVSFIYAQIKELFLVYTEFLTTIFQEAHNLTGRCDAGIDICLSRLCTHLLRSREITSREMIGKLIVMSRHDVGHILQVRTVIHQAKQICFVNHLLTGSIHQQTVFRHTVHQIIINGVLGFGSSRNVQ